MLLRASLPELDILLKEYPVVTIIGPRQAGKTTLVREFLEGYEYSNLEQPETRELAQNDPKAFLKQYEGSKLIIDEIQRVPELLSYIQTIVDEHNEKGAFVLTGSHQLGLHAAITQSLAGRTALLTLLPFSLQELKQKKELESINFEGLCYRGFLPRVHADNMRPTQAYSNYFQTYVERDLRQLIQIKDLTIFEKFLKLMAGRCGQIFDHSSLANDVGVDVKTIKHWLSILEASFILFKLPPYYNNFGKRVIKSPKYYFIETGLLCFLLGIEKPEQITRDPLVGNIFENMVVIDCLKQQLNQGKTPNLYFYRDSNGNEVDLLWEQNRQLTAIEIKSTTTFSTKLSQQLERFSKNVELKKKLLIYNGGSHTLSNGVEYRNFKELAEAFDC